MHPSLSGCGGGMERHYITNGLGSDLKCWERPLNPADKIIGDGQISIHDSF
jgi:hypothetical protein